MRRVSAALSRPARYPRTTSGLVRQCAWCRRVFDTSGRYAIRSRHLLGDATHGICPDCKTAARAEIDADFALAPS